MESSIEITKDPRVVKLMEWLREKNPAAMEIHEDTDLLANQIVDSLGFIELVNNIETLTGVGIDIDDLDVDTFRTIRTIFTTYIGMKN